MTCPDPCCIITGRTARVTCIWPTRFWASMNGKQGGDPAKLARALLTIVDQEQPPFRFIAGADAIVAAEEKLAERRQQIDAYRDLSWSLAVDGAVTA